MAGQGKRFARSGDLQANVVQIGIMNNRLFALNFFEYCSISTVASVIASPPFANSDL
jgi:hypothetical protein